MPIDNEPLNKKEEFKDAYSFLAERFGNFNPAHPVENLGYFKGIHPDIEDILEVMEAWAKQEAIEFAEWLGDYENPFVKIENGRWIQACGNSTSWSTEQLYSLFIQSKVKQ